MSLLFKKYTKSTMFITTLLMTGLAHAEPVTAAQAFQQLSPEAVAKLRKANIDVNALMNNSSNDLIVNFDDKALPAAQTSNTGNVATSVYGNVKNAVLGNLSNATTVMRDYYSSPTSFLRISSREDLVKLLNDKKVVAVMPNITVKPTLTESLPYINQPQVVSKAFKTASGTDENHDGTGSVVAILDTGIDYNRQAFGNCSLGLNKGTCKVAAMVEFADDDSGYPDGKPDDGSFHGTNVAGVTLGVAPGAKVVGLDVFGQHYDYTKGEIVHTAPSDAILAALNWVQNNHISKNPNGLNFVANNMSLGFGNQSNVESNNLPIISTLKNMGVATVVAAGNDNYTNGISWPATEKDAIAVGATYDQTIEGGSIGCRYGRQYVEKDEVTCFSNSGQLLDILAPGFDITAAGINMSGTSQATPHVAGSFAVLRQPNFIGGTGITGGETIATSLRRLQEGGVSVTDYRNGLVRPRLDLLGAMQTFDTF